MSLAIYAAVFVPLMTNCMDESLNDQQKEEKALLAMCFLGLGEVIGSLLNGWLEDRFGPK